MFSMADILLPVDFSQRSLGAARYAEALFLRYGSRVTMLHVIPPPYYEFASMEAGGSAMADWYAKQRPAIEQQCETFLQEELPDVQLKRVVVEGDPAREIVRYSHDGGMSLIVMPTHGYGPFRRFMLGSVTAKVLHDADCPVLTGVHMESAPAYDKIAFKNVVAAIDLGPLSARTLAWAAQFACNHQAKLSVVHATMSLEGRTGEYFDPAWRRHLADEAYSRLETIMQAADVKGEVVIEPGDPAHTVCSQAAKHAADLLVIGRGSASGLLGRMRANAYSIVRESPCPVVSV